MMTPQEMTQRLFASLTKEQVRKAKGYCARHQIDWSVVLAVMTDVQKKAISDAESE